MKSTTWIKQQFENSEKEIKKLEKQISDRSIPEAEYNNVKWQFHDGRESSMSINEMLYTLVAKRGLLEEILRG